MLISKLYLYLKSYGVWVLIAAGLLILPLIFKNGSLLNLLSQMGIWIVFALSYNILLGQAGLFSFGHSVYSGLGAFATIYVLQGLVAGVATSILPFSIPVCLLPLVGGCVGAFFGIVFGAVSTQKSGTPFAMITLGIVELVSTSVLMLPQFFGGESGLSSNRVLQTDVMAVMFGIDLSTSLQLYYLIAVWCFVCMVAMFALTHTPLGRLANALRDNPERLEFIGYNSQWVRFLMVVIAGFFAGISGGLGALNFEIATIENVSAMRSGDVLLATVLGGTGCFFGPVVGAVVFVLFSVALSNITPAWQLYLGLLFVGIVLFAPRGLASVLLANARILSSKKLRQPNLRRAYLGMFFSGGGLLIGGIMVIEMSYHRTLKTSYSNSNMMVLFGQIIDTASAIPWVIALSLIISEGILLRIMWRKWQYYSMQINNQG